MDDRVPFTSACAALALKVMVSLPPVLVKVPTGVPESTASLPMKLRVPSALNTSSAELATERSMLTLAPL